MIYFYFQFSNIEIVCDIIMIETNCDVGNKDLLNNKIFSFLYFLVNTFCTSKITATSVNLYSASGGIGQPIECFFVVC